ncbi:Fasciclin-domain-containing protein, partial [Fragilariopsis cylindrus CCMP1102]
MWKDHLEDLLNYHVLPIVVPSSNITDPIDGLKKSTTLNNEEIIFTLGEATDEEDTGIFVNTDAEVIDADIDIINGIVHVIDNVLLPPWVNKTILDIVSDENPPAELPDDVNVDLVKLDETLEEVFKEAGPDEFDLPNILDSPGGYTVFAPTSAAFLKDASKLEDLNIDQLSSVLSYHVVEGVYPESVLVDGFTLTTLQGEKIRFTSITDGSGTTMVNDETIITPNILANNGIVHVIDGVLIPDGSKDLFDVTADDEDDEDLSLFDKYIVIYPDFVDTLNDDKEITVFAPTNDAFKNLGSDVAPVVAFNLLTGPNITTTMWKDHLEDLLNYHVLPIVVPSSNITDGLKKSTTLNNEEIIFTLGEATNEEDTGIFVNTDAEVIDADIDIINGIVHVIDNVLLPPWVNKTILDIVSDENPPAELPDDVNVDLVKLNETLEEVFKEAGPNEFDLPNILDSPGGYTVFAPTSAAFLE